MKSKGNTEVHAKAILIAGVRETRGLHIAWVQHGPEGSAHQKAWGNGGWHRVPNIIMTLPSSPRGALTQPSKIVIGAACPADSSDMGPGPCDVRPAKGVFPLTLAPLPLRRAFPTNHPPVFLLSLLHRNHGSFRSFQWGCARATVCVCMCVQSALHIVSSTSMDSTNHRSKVIGKKC